MTARSNEMMTKGRQIMMHGTLRNLRHLRILAATAGLGAVLCLATSTQAQTPSLVATHGNVLAYSEGPVPGFPYPDEYFAYDFGLPFLAEDGTVLFTAEMEGGSITFPTNRAIFRGTSAGDLSMVVRASDPAPGLPDLHLINGAGTLSLGALRSSPDGKMLWTSWLSGPGVVSTNDTALFGGPAESPVLVAREGDPAPGTAGAVYGPLVGSFGGFPGTVDTQHTAIDRNGNVLFVTYLTGGDTTASNGGAVFAGPIASPGMLLRLGDTMLPGVIASGIGGIMQTDNDGRVLIDVTLAGAGVTTANNWSLWHHVPGVGRTMLLREGDPAPGTAGATFNNDSNTWGAGISPLGLTRDGKFLFTADLANGDVQPGWNDRAVYLGSTSAAPILISRMGDPAPGTDGTLYGYNPFNSSVNAAGRIVLQAVIAGGTVVEENDSGYWTAAAPGSPLVLVAREGDPAPGTAGATFDSMVGLTSAFNDLGQIVFVANLIGGDVIPDFNNRSVYAWDPGKGLFLLGRGGESVPVSPDYSVTPWSFAFLQNNNTDGAALGLGKNGVVAMTMHLLPQGQAIVTVDLNCYPPAGYHQDADGDGYGDSSVSVEVCANAAPPAGYVLDGSDCDDSDPGRNPGVTDATCNGVDENCDGVADDGATAPTGTATVTSSRLAGNTTRLAWTAVSGATGYDVVRGSLLALASTHGDFSAATTACLADDVATTMIDEIEAPAAGQGFWYALRAVSCGGSASYDSGSPSQVGSRDAGIAASGQACP
jgi:hypothetical protein